MDHLATAIVASVGAGLATGLGALPALLARAPSERFSDAMLGFAGGIMIAASMFGLLVPSFRLGGIATTIFGAILGVAFLDRANLWIPHLHKLRGAEGPSIALRRVWLLILAMVIHNIPEGLAVGVSFGEEDPTPGLTIAIGIGVQNIPEGLAIAFPMIREGYGRWRAVLYATLTGLVEPVIALLGLSVISAAKSLLPIGLAFAAGAMLFVVFNEIIPESYRRGHQREATFSTLVGILVMVTLAYLVS
jgi:zinc transporter, ZIP family